MRLKRILIPVLLALTLSGCALRPKTEPAGEAPPPPASAAPEPAPAGIDVEPWLANMSLEEKVGQLFFVRPDALDPTQALRHYQENGAFAVTDMTPELGNMLVRYPVGGVVIFERNIVSPDQLKTLLNDLQRASKTPLFAAVDEEGGAVSRLSNRGDFGLPRWRSVAAVGAQGVGAAGEMGRTIGAYLREYGFTMDFAPVADVVTDPSFQAIGLRAFSADPGEAAALSGAMAEGLRSEGIVPVYKHFPGHGDTAQDSHLGLAVNGKTLDELRACDWLPYTQNDLTGCAVMVGHIAIPAATGEQVPASLSERTVTALLRGELGFDGLVITDSLAMEGVKEGRTGAQTALAALRAGCDVLLMPEDLPEAYRAVLSAVQSGEVPESRLDESVRRILTYKAMAGLLK